MDLYSFFALSSTQNKGSSHTVRVVCLCLWKAMGWGTGGFGVRRQGHMSNSREESVAITQGYLMPKQHLAMTGQHIALLS